MLDLGLGFRALDFGLRVQYRKEATIICKLYYSPKSPRTQIIGF